MNYNQTSKLICIRLFNSYNYKNIIDDIRELTIGYSAKTFISPFMQDERLKWDMNKNPYYMETLNFQVAGTINIML